MLESNANTPKYTPLKVRHTKSEWYSMIVFKDAISFSTVTIQPAHDARTVGSFCHLFYIRLHGSGVYVGMVVVVCILQYNGKTVLVFYRVETG